MYALIIVIGMLSQGGWQCSHACRCNFSNCWKV